MCKIKAKSVNIIKFARCNVKYNVSRRGKLIYKGDFDIDRATPFSPNGKFLQNAVTDFVSNTKKNFGDDVEINFSLKFYSEVFYA